MAFTFLFFKICFSELVYNQTKTCQNFYWCISMLYANVFEISVRFRYKHYPVLIQFVKVKKYLRNEEGKMILKYGNIVIEFETDGFAKTSCSIR